jgi:hypothetical protein
MKKILVLPIILLLFNSCGVILDSSKIIGKWKLTTTEFYTYNYELDSYKKVLGSDGYFFGSSTNNYFIVFQSTTFDVMQDTIPFITNKKWTLDGNENSITLDVSATSPGLNIWLNGFKTKNYWPMATATTLEITLTASDLNMQYFNIPITGIVKMKGIFTKQQS